MLSSQVQHLPFVFSFVLPFNTLLNAYYVHATVITMIQANSVALCSMQHWLCATRVISTQINSFPTHSSLVHNCYFYPYFLEEETEAQHGKFTKVLQLVRDRIGFDSRHPAPKSVLLPCLSPVRRVNVYLLAITVKVLWEPVVGSPTIVEGVGAFRHITEGQHIGWVALGSPGISDSPQSLPCTVL